MSDSPRSELPLGQPLGDNPSNSVQAYCASPDREPLRARHMFPNECLAALYPIRRLRLRPVLCINRGEAVPLDGAINYAPETAEAAQEVKTHPS